MKTLFWLLGVSAVAVLLALLMGYNVATVSVFWPPHRVDLSLNLALIGLLALFVLTHVALKAIGALRQLPTQARRWRQQQLERVVVTALLDAVTQLLAGRFSRAQVQGSQALEHLSSAACRDWPQRAEWTALSHLLLAEAAHGLRETDSRNTHVQLLIDSAATPDAAREGAVMRALRWAMEDRDLDAAQRWWQQLPQGAARRIHALRLKLRLARLQQQPVEALDTARLLAKHGAFSRVVARSLVRSLAQDAVQAAEDLSQLQSVWKNLSPAEQAMPEIVLAVAGRAIGLVPAGPEAAVAAWQWLAPLWPQFRSLDSVEQHHMITTAEACLPQVDGVLALVEQAQRQWPDDAGLLYLTGQACMQHRLWGKATQALQLALPGLVHADLKRRAWVSLARMAQERGDDPAAAQAWQQAATLT
jgi:HemY protein